MASVFQDEGIVALVATKFHLLAKKSAVGLFAADSEDGHGELGLGEHGKIFGSLRERNEVGPASAHATGVGVGGGVGNAIGFGD